jgi:Rieske Fe-S protein
MPDGILPRRTVLTVAAAAGALTACSTAVPSAPSGSGAAAPTAGSGDDRGPDDDGGGSSGGGPGAALGPASDVPVGSAKIYADRKVVVTQAAAGTYAAFSAICPHEGCAVSSVSGATIVCPCHGSTFALDGSVMQGPAARGLTARKVTVAGGQITVT